MNKMFSFIMKTWNPIAGGCFIEDDEIYACPYRCSYCWARSLINMWKGGNLGKKYVGPYRIHERVIKQRFKPGDFIAVQFMSDIGAPGIPREVIIRVLIEIRDQPDVKFLLLTKSDQFYSKYMHMIPANCVCGITMETDRKISNDLSIAPDPQKRLADLLKLKHYYPQIKIFISIEPIMPFSENFANKIERAEPWKVAVGYDNYVNFLPEPTKDETCQLIDELYKFTTLDLKTIRDAWDEEADS